MKSISLAELMSEFASDDWDEELFRKGITNSLDSGSFILMVVVNKINEELRIIIR